MKKITTIILILIFFSCQSQECNSNGIINWESKREIKIYDKPNGIVTAVLQNDLENENFLKYKIIGTSKDFLKVNIKLEFDNETKIGWIKKRKDVGIYARNYEENIDLILYSKPDKNSNKKSVITEYYPDLYQILDCKNDWLYVKLQINEKIFEGWLQPEMQCPDSYSTCN